MNDKRQKNQLQMALAFTEEGRSEAPKALREGIESFTAKCETESPAKEEQLMEEVCGRENCQQALRRVKANKGSPGIDGMKVSELAGYLKQHWPTIREQLWSGTYRPQPVRRVEIAKPDGGMRKLGIPTVLDRFIQQAVMQVLQRRWDPTFSEHSHGFRPQRSAHQAVAKAQQFIAEGHGWCVDLDLEKFFDRVNHDILMGRLAKRIGDERLLSLIRRYLEAGVLLNGVVVATDEGTPQGGPLSPLLANILLDDLDKELERRGLAFCRYADDCNIYVRSRRAGERTLASVTRFLETKLKLKVNRAKSAVDRPARRKFLGMSIRKRKGEVCLSIAPKSKQRFMDNIRRITKRNRGVSLERVLKDLRTYTNGWVAYFWPSRTPSVFQGFDEWIRRRLRCYQWKLWKTWRNRGRQLRKAGVSRWLAWGVAYNGQGPWRIAGTPVMTKALNNEKLRLLGYSGLHERYLSFASV